MTGLLAAYTAAKALPWRLIGILLAIGGLLFVGWHIEHQATLVAQLTFQRDQATKTANDNAAAMITLKVQPKPL